MKIENGDRAGTQKVTVITEGDVEISKKDAVESLGSNASKYIVKAWSTGDGEASKPKEPKPEMKSNLLAESQEWTSAQGTTITAAVQKVDKGVVYFLKDGKSMPVKVSQLSDETIGRLKALMQPQ